MVKPYYLAAVLLCFFTYVAKAQNSDYIITNNGDTIKCKIKYPVLGGDILFMTDTMNKYEKLNPLFVKQYFHRKDKYPHRLIQLPNEKKADFIDLLEEGKINVYVQYVRSQGYNTSSTNAFYYAQKGTDSIKLFKSNSIFNGKSRKERKAEFIKLIEDNPAVLAHYKAANSFDIDQLKETIHYYNTGKAPEPKLVYIDNGSYN